MQSDYLGPGVVVKMTRHRIAHLLLYFVQGVGIREDGFTQRSGGVSTFWRLLNEKDESVHGSTP